MTTSGEHYQIAAALARLRLGCMKRAYNLFFVIFSRNEPWQDALFDSLALKEDDRVLIFGTRAATIATALARRHPDVNIVGVDPNPEAAERVRGHALRGMRNVPITDLTQSLAIPAGAFDKVVGMFTFHDRAPHEKLKLAREMLRVLRHRGTIHVADFDRPVIGREGSILKLVSVIFGSNVTESHLDGSWNECLVKAGFAGVHRLSTHSVIVGRVAVVQGRKR